MKTLIKISIMVAVFCACSAMANEIPSRLLAKVDTSSLLLGSKASFSRLMRVTMKDGSTEEFLVESVRTLTFQANPNDSSNLIDDDDEEQSDVPDRVPESDSSDSKGGPSGDSSSSGASSSSVEPPSSSSERTPSSSSEKPSSSSRVVPSSDDTPSEDTPWPEPSSSSVTPSSSSETPSAIPNMNYAGTKIMWNSRNQTLNVFSRKSGDARFAVFDVQGVRMGEGNFYVSRGSTSVSLDYMDLPKGSYVVKFELGYTKLQQTIAVTGK